MWVVAEDVVPLGIKLGSSCQGHGEVGLSRAADAHGSKTNRAKGIPIAIQSYLLRRYLLAPTVHHSVSNHRSGYEGTTSWIRDSWVS